MIGDRETPPTDDIGVLWWGSGVRLAQDVKQFIAEIRGTDLTADQVADQLLELLTNPKPRLPDLGDPPAPLLRPAVPVLTLPQPFAEHVARRAQEPGA
jgi:hypothetical protein